MSEIVEVRRSFRGGKLHATTYASENGRITAVLSDGTVTLEREFGVVGTRGGLRLTRDELRALERTCRAWVRVRSRWAAFASVPHGPPGWGLGFVGYFTPPGKGARRVEVGRSDRGRALAGRDEVRPLTVAGVAAEIVRVDERRTPPEGVRVGLVYEVAVGLTLRAKRYEAELRRRSTVVWLEESDVAFVRELVAVTPE